LHNPQIQPGERLADDHSMVKGQSDSQVVGAREGSTVVVA
jgi:hypothetical protein